MRALTRSWLLTSEPESALQARVGLLYRRLRRVRGNPICMAGLIMVGSLVLLTIILPLLPLADPVSQALEHRLQAPSFTHPFGTDTLGRDVLARTLYGARPTLVIVAFVLLAAVPVGVLIGAAAGLLGGVTDRVLMRLSDLFMAFPRLVLAIAVAAVLGQGMVTAMLAIAVTGWPPYARITRAEAATWRRAEFVQAAEALGASKARLLLRHVLPLCLPSALVRAALDAPGIVLISAGLGFLGLGVPPPTPEWGASVADGRVVMFDAWWITTFPGLFILLLGLGFNLLGDGLRDLADPRS